MSHVVRLALFNWGPYRGEHELALGPEVYAVVGRRDDDEESSNWTGKSFLLGALRFVLFDELPDGCRHADDWITRGEDQGVAALDMSDGLHVSRSRHRGKSTQLLVSRLVVGEPAVHAVGRHAADALAQYLAMTAKDFEASSWVGQRAVARLVLATPGERAALVEGWLELDPLREAERDGASRSAKAATTAQGRRDELGKVMDRRLALAPADQDAFDLLQAQIDAAQRGYEQADKEHQAAVAAHAADAAYARAAEQQRQRRERLRLAVEQLQAQVDAAPGADPTPLEEPARRALAVADEARRESVRLRGLVHGDGFDGRCPVTCEACPVADDITAAARQMGTQASAAATAARKAREGADAIEGELARARREHADRRDAEVRLKAARDELRTAVVESPPARRVAGDPDELRATRDAHAQSWRELEAQYAELHGVAEEALALDERMVELTDVVAADDAEAQRWAQAASVLRAARREIAEEAVGAIEADANALLQASGAQLSVWFRWEREGKGLASNCHNCGAAYPDRQSVKVCPRCNADRGQKLVEALELLPSARSGAADDLAGLWVQLAAASWLRDKRGSPLALVVVDEPFAHLDPVNARALGAQVHRGLTGRLRFEQAFVVSHTASITESMPRRIVVRSDGRSSRLEVE